MVVLLLEFPPNNLIQLTTAVSPFQEMLANGDLIVQTANGVAFSGNIYIFGDASVTSHDFTNDGEIDIINNFNVVTTNIFYNLDSAIINANNFNITAYYFYNQDSAMINANNLNAIGVGLLLFSNRRSGSIHVLTTGNPQWYCKPA